jgi:hypothetical protein
MVAELWLANEKHLEHSLRPKITAARRIARITASAAAADTSQNAVKADHGDGPPGPHRGNGGGRGSGNGQ